MSSAAETTVPMPRRTVSALTGLTAFVLTGLVAVLLSGWSEGRSIAHPDARRALWSAGQLEGQAGKLLLETEFFTRSGSEERLRDAERRLEALDRDLAEFGRIVNLLQRE